jgi:hypothetical protein
MPNQADILPPMTFIDSPTISAAEKRRSVAILIQFIQNGFARPEWNRAIWLWSLLSVCYDIKDIKDIKTGTDGDSFYTKYFESLDGAVLFIAQLEVYSVSTDNDTGKALEHKTHRDVYEYVGEWLKVNHILKRLTVGDSKDAQTKTMRDARQAIQHGRTRLGGTFAIR